MKATGKRESMGIGKRNRGIHRSCHQQDKATQRRSLVQKKKKKTCNAEQTRKLVVPFVVTALY